MPVIVTLDVMLARRKKRAKDLAAEIGITEANLSLLRTGKVKGVRFETLAKLCAALDCKPGDLLDYTPGADEATDEATGEADLVEQPIRRKRAL
jgi:putative transcriptional regulator